MKIALVDDDPRALAQLEQYLTEQLGRETEISHYGSGEALLADWRPGAFELVVLDIYMGGATGMEVAGRQEDVFLLKDGTRLPISRRRLREVQEAYSAFRFDRLRKDGVD